MYMYKLTFMDAERGKIRRWKRNQREIDRFIDQWKKEFPLRSLLLQETVQVPTDKKHFIDWLNANCGGD